LTTTHPYRPELRATSDNQEAKLPDTSNRPG
jgi:hypothetical protein